MTVIAWDGTTLAADRRSTMVGLIFSVTKIQRVGDCLVGFSGRADGIGKYSAWIAAGMNPLTFPEQDKENATYLLVIRPGGRIERYESTGWPIIVEERFHASGSGRDFAMAAMHLGFDARKAVEVACALCEDCGNGIDTLSLDAP